MVMRAGVHYCYKVVDESELDVLLSGKGVAGSILLVGSSGLSHLSPPDPGSFGVVFRGGAVDNELAWPCVLISNEQDVRRLCGRYAQLRGDLSPLTAWCHLISPAYLDSLDSLARIPTLEGLDAAWIGLIVAESLLLVDKPVSNVRISACLATQTFAIARTIALWNDISTTDVIKQFDLANRLCRSEGTAQKSKASAERVRTSFEPIWATLIGSRFPELSHRHEARPFISALLALRRARDLKDEGEAYRFAEPLVDLVPVAREFRKLPELGPEERLRLFDKLVEGLDQLQPQRQVATSLLAGYLATVAAGGAPSLSLAENHASRWPEILAWAYLVGGIGERVLWTSAFDGLGRLVGRELLRPFRLDESPTCDFAFDEASVLADAELTDPLVHLRIKQARLVTVALFPGVNISIPIADSTPLGATRPEPKPQRTAEPSGTRESTAALADSLWTHLKPRLDEYLRSLCRDREGAVERPASQKGRGKKKTGSQSQLPLAGEQKRS